MNLWRDQSLRVCGQGKRSSYSVSALISLGQGYHPPGLLVRVIIHIDEYHSDIRSDHQTTCGERTVAVAADDGGGSSDGGREDNNGIVLI